MISKNRFQSITNRLLLAALLAGMMMGGVTPTQAAAPGTVVGWGENVGQLNIPAGLNKLTTSIAQQTASDDENWDAQFSVNGMNARVQDLAFDGNGNLYAGGSFTSAGGIAVNRVAKWDGTKWSALGSGLEGTSNDYAYSLTYDKNGSIYVGGQFTTTGGVGVRNIAKWDLATETWSPVGDLNSSFIYDLAVASNGDLYAGGHTGYPDYVYKWDGSSWSALGSGFNSAAYTIALDDNGNVYAGGTFNAYGPSAVNKVAKWDGVTWSDLGSGTSGVGSVTSLAVDSSGNLYVGGWFAPPPYGLANQVAKWDGSNWTRLGSPMDGYWGYNTVYAVTVDRIGNVYAGGSFSTAGGVSANRIAKWDPTTGTWSPLGTGMNGDVRTLAIDESGNLYAGGDFTTAGGIVANRIAKWDGTSWSALGGGNGMNSYIQTIAVDGAENLYAGGNFTAAGGASANRIAKWNGTNWSALGSGMGDYSYVTALAVDANANLYVGGQFSSVGGVPAKYIAKWDGISWSALGNGMNGWVRAFAIDGRGNLYAGGYFTTAGEVAANYIAKWDGTNWSGLGSGMNNYGYVNALAVDGRGNLYAGGYFTTAGGIQANYIAKWDGTSWSALGSGLNGGVNALAVDGSGNLYAGGSFTTAGGTSANRIAKWDGSSWSALGSGTDNAVYALGISGSELFVGGAFTTAGGKPSSYFGRYVLNAPPTVAAGGPYDVDEGGSVTVIASGSDPENGSLTFAWDLDNNGTFETAGQSATFSAANLDGPSSHTLNVQVTDDRGLSATAQTTVEVLNVAPTAGFANPSSTLFVGQSAILAFNNPFDPGAADIAAGFRYSYDCTNDGVFELADSSLASYACPYPAAGAFTALGRVQDKDGGFTDYTAAIMVLAPQEGIAGLIEQVQALIPGTLKGGQGNALIAKLEAAIQQLDRGNVAAAINQLQSFINQVNALISGGVLPTADGQPLIDAANAIIAALGG